MSPRLNQKIVLKARNWKKLAIPYEKITAPESDILLNLSL